MATLLTGGAGYIGSHIASVLVDKGHEVIIADNLSNSHQNVITTLKKLHPSGTLHFYEGNVADQAFLDAIFNTHQIDSVIHLAGYKAVKESVEKPIEYYQNNINSSLALLEVMKAHKVAKLIFSSSATVYGAAPSPYTEDTQLGDGIPHPYGQTKYMIEQILKDSCAANTANQFTSLRYFNPIGAHPSGLLGERPTGVPNNLMPYIQQVATGEREKLHIFGNDYPTKDGTCLRDYIHVMDVAEAHATALEHAQNGYIAYNVGTGKATSVLELVRAFEYVNDVTISHAFDERREGDLAESYADVSLAATQLHWCASRTIEDACRDSWNFTKHFMDKKS